MRVGSGVILFQLAGFLTSALADFYFAKHRAVLHCKRCCGLVQFSYHADGFLKVPTTVSFAVLLIS